MTSLTARLNDELKAAMRARDSQRRNAIRLLQSALKQVEIDTRSALDAEAELTILRREAKQRRETISELEAAGRADATVDARYELGLIESFLPQQLTSQELMPIVSAAVAEVGATSVKQMGEVMRVVMPQVQSRADGKAVSEIVRELLR
ncbi:MAG: GatB/YqeY domain-containing protein [Chloroflexi bacterium]|nr:GatB/YqeY domain-containing protein [Chloroflexota bacterium]MCY4246611.1 GatB/YqeY domain-containing protein [Chloroflexota bacterium]